MKSTLSCLLLASTLAGCVSTAPSTPARNNAAPDATVAVPMARSAVVALGPASGSLVSGRLTAMPMADGVHFTGEIGGLAPNSTHALHVHEKGDCSAADASSAGGHFNPRNQAHGKVGSAHHHAGDMDNIVADAQGVARVDAHAQGVTLGGGAGNILGRAVVVHASPDDYSSQPAGNAGARVACGLLKATP